MPPPRPRALVALCLLVLAASLPGSASVQPWAQGGSGPSLAWGLHAATAPREALGSGWAQLAAQGEPLLCILDSGVDAQHEDLEGRVVAWRDFVAGQARAYDDDGHGTHVSGTAAGSGAAQPEHRGVAPRARLAVGKVMDAHGHGTARQAMDGIAWCAQLGAQVINVSLELDDCGPARDVAAAIARATAAGSLVVVAAGNRGAQPCALHAPANVAAALTVGALGGPTLEAGGVAGFSGRGAPGQGKPDLVAPGVGIVAASAGTHDGYRTMDGTSMASPFVAAVAGLLRVAHPEASPEQVEGALRATARGSGAWDPAWGWGAVQPAEALAWLDAHAG